MLGKTKCAICGSAFYTDAQRLSVAAVRDCGLLSCPPTPKFERGRMLDLSLKPLLLLHFVMGRIILKV